MSVSCDCCGIKVDERSLSNFVTKFICNSCRNSNTDLELAEGLYGVDASVEYVGDCEYCATVSINGKGYVGNADSDSEAIELALRNMIEGDESKTKEEDKFLELKNAIRSGKNVTWRNSSYKCHVSPSNELCIVHIGTGNMQWASNSYNVSDFKVEE